VLAEISHWGAERLLFCKMYSILLLTFVSLPVQACIDWLSGSRSGGDSPLPRRLLLQLITTVNLVGSRLTPPLPAIPPPRDTPEGQCVFAVREVPGSTLEAGRLPGEFFSVAAPRLVMHEKGAAYPVSIQAQGPILDGSKLPSWPEYSFRFRVPLAVDASFMLVFCLMCTYMMFLCVLVCECGMSVLTCSCIHEAYVVL
jgi:hypothetical protein